MSKCRHKWWIPYALISRKKVTDELLEQFHVKAAVLVDRGLEEMLESGLHQNSLHHQRL
ncbi:MAG: hypothetical protein R2759_11305 [Bacteroidales bacterium]